MLHPRSKILLQHFITNSWRACSPKFPKVLQNVPKNNFEEIGELFMFLKHFWGTWGTIPAPQVLLRNLGNSIPQFPKKGVFWGKWGTIPVPQSIWGTWELFSKFPGNMPACQKSYIFFLTEVFETSFAHDTI